MDEIPLQRVLEVVGNFDKFGGASLSLIAWELFVEEQLVVRAWKQRWRKACLGPLAATAAMMSGCGGLTAGGWAARNGHSQ
ncbi:MAG: hypothetical protein WBP81_38940 [Solirubrobacteraceae bacterium]